MGKDGLLCPGKIYNLCFEKAPGLHIHWQRVTDKNPELNKNVMYERMGCVLSLVIVQQLLYKDLNTFLYFFNMETTRNMI